MILKRLKELTWVIALLLLAAVFVFVRETNKNRFSETTENIAETLKSKSVFIQAGELNIADYLVVELGENSNDGKYPSVVKVAFEGLTDKNFREQLETSGKKILLTGNESQTAKAWVILNQMGIENIFILTEKEKPETSRYSFIPDTTGTVVSVE
jgi:hypothetical protein